MTLKTFSYTRVLCSALSGSFQRNRRGWSNNQSRAFGAKLGRLSAISLPSPTCFRLTSNRVSKSEAFQPGSPTVLT